jgi:hypothetical protein
MKSTRKMTLSEAASEFQHAMKAMQQAERSALPATCRKRASAEWLNRARDVEARMDAILFPKGGANSTKKRAAVEEVRV